MTKLKVYCVDETRDLNMPRAMATLLHASVHRQSPYFVAAHTKTEALARLRQVGTHHHAGQLRVLAPHPTPHGAHAIGLLAPLTNAGDIVGYVRNGDGDPIALIPAGDTEPRIVAHWQTDPDDNTRDAWRRRRIVVPAEDPR